VRAPEDLHPDDTAMRVMLRDLIVYTRQRAKLSQRKLAPRVGIGQSALAQVERSLSWRVSTLQRVVRGLDRRLLLRPLGLPEPPAEVLALAAMRPADPVRADAWDVAAVVAEMTAARKALRVTQESVGEVLGCGPRAVGAVEMCESDVLLGTLQRYCRALGGALWVGLG
jgi:Helix-turn-helix.